MSEPNLNPELEQQLREALDAPAPEAAFANRLRAALLVKAAEMKPERKPSRLVWRLAFALVLLALLGFFFGPKIVTAMRQLFGYVPGAGLVDQSVPLRVLAEPVTLTREGVTLTVESAVLSVDKTIVAYSLKNVPWEALSHQENAPGCMGAASLRLPNGTELASGEGGGTMSSFSFTYPAIAAEVNDATFLLPCLMGTLPGKAPENWEAPLHFVPAPPDFQVAPVVDVPTPTAAPAVSPTPNPLTLEKVVQLPGGYILTGHFDSRGLFGDGQAMGISEWPVIQDSSGRQVFYETPANAIEPSNEPGVFPWAYQFKSEAISWPISLTFSAVDVEYHAAQADFQFDAGVNPQDGQQWKLDQDLTLAGRKVRATTVRRLGQGYEFNFEASDGITGLGVTIPGYNELSGGGGGDGAGNLSASLEYDKAPSGMLTIRVSAPIIRENGPWSVQWQPEGAQPGTPSPFGIALSIDKYIPLDDGY